MSFIHPKNIDIIEDNKKTTQNIKLKNVFQNITEINPKSEIIRKNSFYTLSIFKNKQYAENINIKDKSLIINLNKNRSFSQGDKKIFQRKIKKQGNKNINNYNNTSNKSQRENIKLTEKDLIPINPKVQIKGKNVNKINLNPLDYYNYNNLHNQKINENIYSTTYQNYNNNLNIFQNTKQYYIKYNNIFDNPFPQSSIYYKKSQNPYLYSNIFPYNYNKNTQLGNYKYINPYNYKVNNNNYNYNYNEDVKTAKLALNLIKTKIGCGILKEKSLANHYFANELLFSEIKNNLETICCNILGSSLMITLLDVLSYENIDMFLNIIKENFLNICLTEPGSRVIQKLIEKINEFPLLLNKFIFNLNEKNIEIIIKSQYGNYIFRKYLSIVKNKEYIQFLYNYIYKYFLSIIKEKYGVCVIIRALNEADDSNRKRIIEYILKDFEIIIKNCYGNFLIRHILLKFEKKSFDEILPFITKIEEKIVDYCKNQYSSSIIEKCFEKGEQEISEHMVKYLLDYHLNSIIEIVDNIYGFYVIKKIFSINNKKLKETLMKFIVNNINKFKKYNDVNNLIKNFSDI